MRRQIAEGGARLRSGFTKWFCLFWLTLISAVVLADEVVCPVCGQTFSKEVASCPNDGSDLSLVGIKKKDEPADTDETGQSPSPPSEDQPADKEKVIKYKRLDTTGERRRETESTDVDFSDRRSRMLPERRGAAPAQEKKKRPTVEEEPVFDLELDLFLREAFAKQRRDFQQQQVQIEVQQETAKKQKKVIEERNLYSMGAPLASLGYRVAWMGEGHDNGLMNATEIDVNLSRRRIRTGLSTLIGARSLSRDNELLFLEHISIGIQEPWRFSPYVVIRGGIGALAAQRFERSLVYFLTAVGGEAGIDCWITPWVVVSPSLGYTRFAVDEAYWNSFTAKISLGF